VTAFARARGDFANSCAALQQKGVLLHRNNLSQFFAVADHQSGRELIRRSHSAAAAASMQAAREQNDDVNAETNAGIAATQQTEINSGM
jgi:hypothetical protein